MTHEDAAAAVAAFWCGDDDPAEEAAFQKALLEQGYAALPSDRLMPISLKMGLQNGQVCLDQVAFGLSIK